LSTLIQVHRGSKAFGAKLLFDQASLAVNEGEHLGVIGPNGAGKTTLFKILVGDQELDSGEVIKSKTLRLGYLSQHDEWLEKDSAEDFLRRDLLLPLWDLKSLGKKLGLSESIYSRPLKDLSGGYRMRCKLLKLLGAAPNLMLLDEPTNYLDLETTLVLENFLQDYEGAFLLISHDREFLKRTTDHTLEVEAGDMTKFNGHIDDYFEQKALLREQLTARAASLAEKRSQILEFVNRFGAKASKAKQAQSRLKTLEKLETVEIKPLPVGARIFIPPPEKTSKLVLSLKEAELGYAQRRILENVNLQIEFGDHLAIVGLNGAGKSTILKSLAGSIPLLKGQRSEGTNLRIGFFAQHVTENLDLNNTVLEAFTAAAATSVTLQECLNLAGTLLFSGEDVHKKLAVLSGGERARVALGKILLSRVNVLILDEPTNHLDFQTVEALTQALQEFAGACILVSHDRGFIRRIATKILEVREGQVRVYPGSYDDYLWSLQKGVLSLETQPLPSLTTSQTSSPVNSSRHETKKNLERSLKKTEKRMQELDSSIREKQLQLEKLSQTLSSGSLSHMEAQDISARISDITQQLETEETEWLTLAEDSETLTKDLNRLRNSQS
jgi:ATP-binding cassette subfamily F protein 3